MTRAEALARVGCLVRIRRVVGGSGYFTGRIIGVDKRRVCVQPKGHRHGEWLPFDRIKVWRSMDAMAGVK